MKRLFWVVALVVVAGLLLLRSRHSASKRVDEEHSSAKIPTDEVRRVKEAPLVRRPFPTPGPTPEPSETELSENESPVQIPESPPRRDFAFWKKNSDEHNDMMQSLLPENLAEIEAVAPRLHLTPQQVERLKRWEVNSVNLTLSAYSSITTQPELDTATTKAINIMVAHQKAEIRLIGRDNYLRYLKLKSASQEGGLDQVDDNGALLPGGNVSVQAFHDNFGKNQLIDTSEFDSYFKD